MKVSVLPPKRPRALFLGLFALCAGTASLGIWSLLREPPARPNIVLIVADTLRQDYLGSYGFRGDISPTLDRLASESILFENAISAAPWTPPAVASIFTSTYVQTHGLHGFRTNKVTKEETGERLKIYALNERLPTLASST